MEFFGLYASVGALGAATFLSFEVLFWVCLVIGILLLALAVVMFFVFDIPNIYMIKSGKGERQTVRRMKEINAETGRLRGDNKPILETDYSNMTADISREKTSEKLKRQKKNAVEHAPQQEPVSPVQTQQPDTPDAPFSKGDTVMLGVTNATEDGEHLTTLLDENMSDTGDARYYRRLSGSFVIEYNLMMIHSNEIL